jgi:ppGpp synthetase/RelA/SpoT-type nucleotidyltranferase
VEARRVAGLKVAEVQEKEPAISAAVRGAVRDAGGVLKRFDSRVKSEDSLYRKVQDIMVDDETDADDAIAEVPDALRYTAVVDENDYWATGSEIGAALERAGYKQVWKSRGWRRFGYKGRNDTFISPDGLRFEVQIHTQASLDAAERAHVLYEEQRRPTTPEHVKAQLDEEQNGIFASVPAPNDVKWVD